MLDVNSRKALFSFAEENRSKYERQLRELVEIPTVSMNPDNAADIHRGVDCAVEILRPTGGKVRVIRTGGYPLVHAEFFHSRKAPWITLYNHLDVQPASRESEPWRTNPFEMTSKDGRYYGRGTTDDKGPALAALYGVRAARSINLPINIHVLWEFEEEIGSPNFAEGIKKLGSSFQTDSIVVSDTIWISPSRPASSAGLRGAQPFLFFLKTGEADTHSGDTGGAARNPLGELIHLICKMHDPVSGEVKIPGFYKDVVPPSPQELRDFAKSGFSVRDFKRTYALSSLRTEDPMEVMQRIWARPTFEVHGMVGGYVGPGIKAVVPPSAEVKASCRLVPNQKPEKIAKLVSSFAKKICPDVEVRAGTGVPPYQCDTKSDAAEALSRAIYFAFGKRPVFVREGGSIGAVSIMDRLLRVPIVFLGLSLPAHGYHAPNENFDWRQASGGIVAFARYFYEMSQLKS
jgi:acetylornithine deacetylase/succinyl-diaminopimelate desuccinylase-like protein